MSMYLSFQWHCVSYIYKKHAELCYAQISRQASGRQLRRVNPVGYPRQYNYSYQKHALYYVRMSGRVEDVSSGGLTHSATRVNTMMFIRKTLSC